MKPSVLSMGSKVPLPAALRDGGMTRLAGIAVLLLLPLVIRAQGSGTRAEADALFTKGKFADALPLYTQLVSLTPADHDLNYRLGTCIVHGRGDKEKAIGFLKYAVTGPTVPAQAWYYYGRAYHLTYQFAAALEAYERYRGTVDKKTLAEHPVDALELQCRNGKELLNNIKDIEVRNKVEVDEAEFFRFYDLGSIGGKIVVTPEELKSTADKKSGDVSLVYLPDKGGPIYFASYGKGGTGRDIYRTELMPNGNFATPVKLAGYINTDQDDDFPFMAPDGKSFYFCSKGHNSMGGYDVFKSSYDKGLDVFGAPENMDFAVNTPDDELLYLTDPEGKEACFASGRSSQQGTLNVYRVNTAQAPVNLTVLKGTFASQFDPKDRKAHITVVDVLTQQPVTEARTDLNGNYVLSLPRSGKYRFLVEAGPGGKTHAGMVELPRSDGPRAYRQELSLEDQGGEKLVIRNYFDEPLEEDMIALALEEIKRRARLDVGGTVAAQEEPAAAQAPAGDPLTRAGFAGDVTRNDALRMAGDDAADLTRSADAMDQRSAAAYHIAEKNAAVADALTAKAGQFVAQANMATDDTKKNALMIQAGRYRANARAAHQRATAALHAGEALATEARDTRTRAATAGALHKSLQAALAGTNEDAMVADLTRLRTRMDEKNAPDGSITPAEKMRRQATQREKESAAQIARAHSARNEENDLADRIGRIKREEAEAKGGKREELARDRAGLEAQLDALRAENDRALAKARAVEQETVNARGQAALARKLETDNLATDPYPADKRSQLAQQIAGTGPRIGAIELDERFDGGSNMAASELERRTFDWDTPVTLNDDGSGGDILALVGNTGDAAGADAANAGARTTASTEVADGDAGGRAATGDEQANDTEERADAQQGASIGEQAGADVQQAAGARTTASTETPASNTAGHSTQGADTGEQEAASAQRTTSDGAAGTGLQPPVSGTSTGDNAGARTEALATSGGDQRAVSPGADDVATTRGAPVSSAADGAGSGTGREVGNGREEGAITEEVDVPTPEEVAFVQANELAELKQMRGAERDRQRRDSLDARIADLEQAMRAAALAEAAAQAPSGDQAGTTAPNDSMDAGGQPVGTTATDTRTEVSDAMAVPQRAPLVFDAREREDVLIARIHPDYATGRERLLRDTNDAGERAAALHGLELMLVDSIGAETDRQLARLERDTTGKAGVLARVDRLRALKEEHIRAADEELANAGQRYEATEYRREEDAMLLDGVMDPASPGAVAENIIVASPTPHNDDYVHVRTEPELVYSSTMDHRSTEKGFSTAIRDRDRDMDMLTGLEERIDSLETVLEGMPVGRDFTRLRDRTDKLIDQHMVLRMEIGQRMEFITRSEYKEAQDSVTVLTALNNAKGLAPSEPMAQLASSFEQEAARAMDAAAAKRKEAGRIETVVTRDSLYRNAYAEELTALRLMDRAQTVRGYMQRRDFQRGERISYEQVEERMFGAPPEAPPVAEGIEEDPAPGSAPASSAVPPGQVPTGVTGTPAGGTAAAPASTADGSISSAASRDARAKAAELEAASLSAADRASTFRDSIPQARRGDRAGLEREALRLSALSDSLHRAALAADEDADRLEREAALAKDEQDFRERLMRFYYLGDEDMVLILNDEDRSRYFQARAKALAQQDEAVRANEQAAASKALADTLLGQSTAILASTDPGGAAPTPERMERARLFSDQAVRLNQRSDSLVRVAARLDMAAKANASQAATILQGLTPERGTAIMAMEQRARRVEPLLAEARSLQGAERQSAAGADTLTGAQDVPAAHDPATTGSHAGAPPPAVVPPASTTEEQVAQSVVSTDVPASSPAFPTGDRVAENTAVPPPAGPVEPAERPAAPVAAAVPPTPAAGSGTGAPALLPVLVTDVFSMDVIQPRTGAIPIDAPMPAGVVYKVQIGAFKQELPAAVFSDMTPVSGERVGNGLTRYTAGMFTTPEGAVKAAETVRQRGYRDAFVVAYQDGRRVSLTQAMRAGQPVTARETAGTRPGTSAAQTGTMVRIETPATTAGTTTMTDSAHAAEQAVLANYPASAEEVLARFSPPADVASYYNVPDAAPARQVETVKGLFFTVQVGVYSRPVALDKLFNITPLNSERTENAKIRYTTGVYVDMEKARARKDEAVAHGVKDAFITAYLNGTRIPMRDARALLNRFGRAVFADPAVITR